ncbi:P-loop containing nucleoside triphosphate hydrolase protein [Mycena rebaudengoi]|nr:P-loop containing nucleoside triphosphate hydrolase protein [Mycena rebaudengoi]
MSQNNTQKNWPPLRLRGPATPPLTPIRTRAQLHELSDTPSTLFGSPRTPLSSLTNRKLHRNGFETAPKTPSYTPFALNNPGYARQKAFTISNPMPLAPCPALDPYELTALAARAGAIPADATLRSFQVEISNFVTMRRGDAVVISPTGSGKSLAWILPLLARGEGISLVITPYTSLGLDGESSNECEGITSLFIYSEQNSLEDFEKVAAGNMMVVYVCPEMLESPSFARILHSPEWRRRLSGIYIDEAHLIYQTHHWRPCYSRLYILRNIIGGDIPFIALSATCPEHYRDALIAYAGLKKEYHLINLGNYRPELSMIILPLQHDVSSFIDLVFVIPLGCRSTDIVKTLIYCDDLELLTKMMWWAYYRLASMGLPTHLVDIIHAGLSDRHQKLCLEDFRADKTKILLGSSKISAGMNFGGVRRVIQYKVRGISSADVGQRFGRGARRKGETSVGVLFYEPSFALGAGLSVDAPKEEDPGLIELIQSDDCAQQIMDRQLENPPHSPSCVCCNRCDPSLCPALQYQWIAVNPGPSSSVPSLKSTDEQREIIFQHLASWRLKIWQTDWRDAWPSYGPKCLVSDADLDELVKHAGAVHTIDAMLRYTHILHWAELSEPLLRPSRTHVRWPSSPLPVVMSTMTSPNPYLFPILNVLGKDKELEHFRLER